MTAIGHCCDKNGYPAIFVHQMVDSVHLTKNRFQSHLISDWKSKIATESPKL